MVAHSMTEPQARDLLKYADQPPVGAAGMKIRRKAEAIEQAAQGKPMPISMPSPDQPAALLKICNFCGNEFPKGLLMHMKWCKSRPQGESALSESGVQAGQDADAPKEE